MADGLPSSESEVLTSEERWARWERRGREHEARFSGVPGSCCSVPRRSDSCYFAWSDDARAYDKPEQSSGVP